MIHSKITNQTPLAFVTLDEAKRQLNIIDDESDDIHINDLLNSAMELAEKATKRKLSPCTVTLSMQGVYRLYLPYGEVESLTSVKVGDVDVPHSFNAITQILTVDDSNIDRNAELIVTYNAGYLTPNVVPNAVKMGVKMLLSTLYEYREDFGGNMSVENIPLASKTLFDSCKLEYSL